VNVDRKQAEGKIQGRDGNPAVFLRHPYSLEKEQRRAQETRFPNPKRSENDQPTISPKPQKVGGKTGKSADYFQPLTGHCQSAIASRLFASSRTIECAKARVNTRRNNAWIEWAGRLDTCHLTAI
jgi:hypothetical protein